MVDIDAYLARIGYAGSRAPTGETLAQLQQAHMLAVPFENLDIALGRPISLDEPAVLRKIVQLRRGGFCYEANSAFAALLRALGYRVDLLSAGVMKQSGGFGPDFDHLTLLIHLAEPLLVDVGFGDSFRAPLRLHADAIQAQPMGSYRLDHDGATWTLMQLDDSAWQPQYRFTLQPHAINDFISMCHYHQTSPESGFTRRRICTRATPDGRITLSDSNLIITAQGERTERPLATDAEVQTALAEHFGIDLSRV